MTHSSRVACKPEKARPLALCSVGFLPHQAFYSRSCFLVVKPCLVFSLAVFSFVAHQETSAQNYSLPSRGKLSPCKPRISSKTKCSSAVTQATKCWRCRAQSGEGNNQTRQTFPSPLKQMAQSLSQAPVTQFPSKCSWNPKHASHTVSHFLKRQKFFFLYKNRTSLEYFFLKLWAMQLFNHDKNLQNGHQAYGIGSGGIMERENRVLQVADEHSLYSCPLNSSFLGISWLKLKTKKSPPSLRSVKTESWELGTGIGCPLLFSSWVLRVAKL